MKVSIYGLFYRDVCLYVGRTVDVRTRQQCHSWRFKSVIGCKPELRVFCEVTPEESPKIERAEILKYKAIGQAQFNRNLPFSSRKMCSFQIRAAILSEIRSDAEDTKISISEWLRNAVQEKLGLSTA
jgi:hypothetical protein